MGSEGKCQYFFDHRQCCISQIERALQLVSLAGRYLLYGPLKVKVVFVAKMFRDLSPSVSNFFSK